MIKEMARVRIIGPKTLLDDCIRTLHETAVVHIETAPSVAQPIDAFFKRLPLDKERALRKELLDRAALRVKEAATLLPAPASYRAEKVEGAEIFARLDALAAVEAKVKSLHARMEGSKESLSVIEKYGRLLSGFLPIVPRLGGFKNFDIIGLTIEKERAGAIRLLEDEVRNITGGNCEMHTAALDEATIGVVLAFQRKFEERIRRFLTGRSINEVRLPGAYEDMTLVEALTDMEGKKREIPEAIKEAQGELEDISRQWYGVVAGLAKAVEDAIEEAGALTYAAESQFAFAVEGYLPAASLASLKERFSSLYHGAVLVSELPISGTDAGRVPVFIENRPAIRPFEIFLSAIAPPRYGSIDPTPYIAVFFPAFFGIIVGDVGYGAVLFALSLWARKRLKAKPFFRDIAAVLAVCSAAAVIFGLLFGEFFGDLGLRLGILHPLLLHRAEALKTFLVLTLGIGVGHVSFGFIIGAANNLTRRRYKEAGAKAAHLAAVLAFLAAIAAALEYLPKHLFTPLIAVLVAAFAFLVLIEGVTGPLESIKALGNMLSYMRLMAVGAGSVIMANVANKIGGRMGNVAVGIIAAGLIHLINIALSLLSPVIQSTRLQYVEFFSKFYEAGGKRYKPFSKR